MALRDSIVINGFYAYPGFVAVQTTLKLYHQKMLPVARSVATEAPVVGAPGSSVDALPADTIAFAYKCFDAARNGNPDSDFLLHAIDAGLPANLTNDKGNTLLMLAAYAGHTDLVKSLLARGADPNRLNDLGQSIIAGAVFKLHDDIVLALLHAGADPRIGKPNAIQAAYMFRRNHLLPSLGATEADIGPDVPTALP